MGDDSAGVADERTESGREEEPAAGDQEWEDADSSDGETFFLDPNGRVPFAGNVSFDFRSAPNALTAALAPPDVVEQVVKDCRTVATARASKMAYSTGKTFWMQADRVPRNSLERLALDIFEAHTAGARFNRAASGAEWWTQVINDSDDIGWHWDKDYGMEAQGINVHPCLATVTYLSTNGGPTVILEKKAPMACEDVRGVSGEASKAWVSQPALGKHICFDGRYLHAAPADLARAPPPPTATPVVGRSRGDTLQAEVGSLSETNGSTAVSDGRKGAKKRDKDGELKVAAAPPAAVAVTATAAGDEAAAAAKGAGRGGQAEGGNGSHSRRRVTFLVNVWLNHAPRSADALPRDMATELGRPRLEALLAPGDFVAPKVLRVRGQDLSAETSTAGVTVAESGEDGGRRGSGAEPEEVCGAAAAATAAAVEMRWEFGEVGDEAETHLRHEVLVPVPGVLLPGAASSVSGGAPEGRQREEGQAVVAAPDARGGADEGVDGGSFCVEYPSTGLRPRVSRMGAEDEEGEEGGGSREEEEEEEEEEEDEEEEEEEEEGEAEGAEGGSSSEQEEEDARPSIR
eukprot:g6395.t1